MSETLNRERSLTPAEEAECMQQGRTLVSQLTIFLKTARIYEPENNNYKLQLIGLNDLVLDHLRLYGDLTLQMLSGYLFYNSVRVRADYDAESSAGQLLHLFQKLGISGLMIDLGVSAEDLRALARILNDLEQTGSSGYHVVRSRFDSAQIEAIEPLPLVNEDSMLADEDRQKRMFAKKTFFSAIANLKNVIASIGSNQAVSLRKTTRVLQALVDQVIADDRYLVELTVLRNHDAYTFHHSANVCVYSICLGSALKLSKSELANLGFAALFHDIGKTELPVEVLNKQSEFTDADWDLVRRHPTYGVLAIAKTMPFDDKSARAMIVAFEHHFNLDGSGYPALKFRRDINLYSRIVAICDVFDALTTGRTYRKEAVSPEHVLRTMLEKSGSKFDPYLLRLFVRTVSVYPPGTLLLLDDSRLAISIGRNPVDLFRPRVKIIGDLFQLYEMAEEIDLAESDRQGQHLRSIVRAIAPEELPVDLSHYILQSYQ